MIENNWFNMENINRNKRGGIIIKKFKMVVIAFVVALLVPSSVFASSIEPFGSGDWDYQGKDVFTKQSAIFKSGGGDFKICLSKNSKHGSYRLMEEDPYNPDDLVDLSDPDFPYDFDADGCYVYEGVDRAIDGNDNQAEFYVIKWTGGNSTVYAYD
ncbi:hypothetical protein [Priestia endophytica]|uniref:hypothetical protein n=1 Tax=Priestia endophytica TaxID=135735 RepID=UPI000DCA83C5|nr:hypothetical protein [Priestia endophytica]RAS86424.1 hypothetical protein A4U60_07980 [Priestia endophytica]